MVTLLTTRYFSVGKQRVSNGEYTDHRGLSTKNFMVSKVTMRYFREVFQMVTKLTIGISGTVFGNLRQIFVPPIFFRSVFLDRISWNLAGAKGLRRLYLQYDYVNIKLWLPNAILQRNARLDMDIIQNIESSPQAYLLKISTVLDNLHFILL